MGFADKLAGILSNLPIDDPLFGGLIPRQERPVGRTIVDAPPMRDIIDSPTPIRRTGMEKVNNNFLNQDGQARPGNVKFDWTEQELGLAKRKQDLDQSKFMYERDKDSREFGLKDREQDRKERDDRNRLGLDREKYDIDLRKQALDEWRAKNPEGEIKTDDDGRLMIIDKRTGKSTDTGLKADMLGEEDKLRIQHINRLKEIELQNKGRARNINPSQQRTAEKDAYDELIRSGKYDDIADYVTTDESGKISIKRPSTEEAYQFWRSQSSNDQKVRDIQNINSKIAEFEKEWKTKSDERMNRTFDTGEDGMVEMTDPDGGALRVPKADVERLKAVGAKVVGEDNTTKDEPIGKMLNKMTQVDDSIELMYNDKGAVIGARNRKPAGSSK